MRLINAIYLGSSNGANVRLDPNQAKLDSGLKARAIRIIAVFTVVNSTDGAAVVKASDILDFFRCLFSQWFMSFGAAPGATDVADNNLSFDQMRMMLAFLTEGDDVQVFNAVTSAWVELYSLSADSAVSGSIAAAGTTTVKICFIRPFTVASISGREHEWCPGSTQVRQMALEITRGSSFNPTNSVWTQQGLCEMKVLADTLDSKLNVWAVVPRAYKNTTPGIIVRGPGGILIAALDFSYTGYASPLSTYSVERDGDIALHDDIELQDYITEELMSSFEEWLFDPNSLCTVLYRNYNPSKINDLPCATRFLFRQPGNDLANPNFIWIYIPDVDEYHTKLVSKNVTDKAGGNAAAVNLTAIFADDHTIDAHIVSCSPMAIRLPGSKGFNTKQGAVTTKGGTPQPYVPPAVATAANAHASLGTKEHAAAVNQNVSKGIPGHTQPNRKSPHKGAGKVSGILRAHAAKHPPHGHPAGR